MKKWIFMMEETVVVIVRAIIAFFALLCIPAYWESNEQQGKR